MSEKLVEKIIGAAYVVYNNKFFAADLYEGNYYKILDGNVVKTIAANSTEYERVKARYEECVKNDKKIETAYEVNKRANQSFSVPKITADPEAAEKEWYIRKHPEVVLVTEPEKKKKGLLGIFSRKKKESMGIKCIKCGTVNAVNQKFCGECGEKLPSAEKENEENSSVMTDSGDGKVNSETSEHESGSGYKEKTPSLEEAADKIISEDTQSVKEETAKIPEQKNKENIEAESQEMTSAGAGVQGEMKEFIDFMLADEEIDGPDNRNVKQIVSSETVIPEKEVKENYTEEAKEEHKKKVKEKKEILKTVRKEKRKPVGKKALIIIFMVVILIVLVCMVIYAFSSGRRTTDRYDYDKYESYYEKPSVPDTNVSEAVTENYVVVRIKNDISMNQQIKEEDIEGTVLSAEQYEKYSRISTYIDSNGQTRDEELLLWENKDDVIGKYAAHDLTEGSILYDTSITTEHVVADKTFVDVEVDGEKNTIEVDSSILPGNTRIQIIAIVQTDNEDPQQVLLSEMTLQDRSLQSIFDAAGQNILEKISSQSEETDTADTQPDTAAENIDTGE